MLKENRLKKVAKERGWTYVKKHNRRKPGLLGGLRSKTRVPDTIRR
ncbi:hypothetical protein HN777_00660 [Candidatus Woesearchaeota archaeon]|jgi:hypothetical protein|nr:hypothetical protein [Candidatus Woesearchaeota archaeon]MBT7402283.1 hypothetical protein [Candidatus Woesearchaeota archaeon]